MRAEFKNNALVVVPETEAEIKTFHDLFPESFLKNSKYLSVKQFVDAFGNPESDKPYLWLNGHTAEAKTVREKKAPKTELVEENASQLS